MAEVVTAEEAAARLFAIVASIVDAEAEGDRLWLIETIAEAAGDEWPAVTLALAPFVAAELFGARA